MELTIPRAHRINPKACQKESNPHRIKQSLLHDDFIHSNHTTLQKNSKHVKKELDKYIQVSLHEHHIGDQR